MGIGLVLKAYQETDIVVSISGEMLSDHNWKRLPLFLYGYWLGHAMGKIMPKGIEFYDKYDQRLESFKMANFLACHPDQVDRFKRIKPWMM